VLVNTNLALTGNYKNTRTEPFSCLEFIGGEDQVMI